MKLWMFEKPPAYTATLPQWFKTEGLPPFCSLFPWLGQRSTEVSQEHTTLDEGSAHNTGRGTETEENI